MNNEFEIGMAQVGCEEIFTEDCGPIGDDLGTEENAPTCDDLAPDNYDGPADDAHMYPDDVEQDEYPW
jgi:hypothetical protein